MFLPAKCDELRGDVQSVVIDLGPVMSTDIFVQMGGSTAQIQYLDSLSALKRRHHLQHHLVTDVDVRSLRPIHSEMAVAVPLQALLVVINDSLIRLARCHLTKLASTVRREVAVV